MSIKPTISYEDFSKLDLRIATIISAEPHPNADRLIMLQIDLGDQQRQILAGIKQFYEYESLVGRNIVVLANLAPRNIRGQESNGMLLAASVMQDEELKDVVLLGPDKQVPSGSAIS